MTLNELNHQERVAFLREHLYFLGCWADELPDGWMGLGYALQKLLIQEGLHDEPDQAAEALMLIEDQQVQHRLTQRQAETQARRARLRVIRTNPETPPHET